MSQKRVIACVPANKELLSLVGHPNYTPGPGGIKIPCPECGQDMWFGKKSQELKALFPETEVICMPCLHKSGKISPKTKLQSLGGNSSSPQ